VGTPQRSHLDDYGDAPTLWTGFRERFISAELVDRHFVAIDGQLGEAVRSSAVPLTHAEPG
jgi:hypothetical protein